MSNRVSWFCNVSRIRLSIRTQIKKQNSISINLFNKSKTLVVQKFPHPSASFSTRQQISLLRPNMSASLATLCSSAPPSFEEANQKPGKREEALPSRRPREGSEIRAKHQGRGRREVEVQTGTIWPAASKTDTLKDGGPRAGPESASREPHY